MKFKTMLIGAGALALLGGCETLTEMGEVFLNNPELMVRAVDTVTTAMADNGDLPGQTSATNNGNYYSGANSQSSGSMSAASTGMSTGTSGQSAKIEKTYTYTCPSGDTSSVPISATTQACVSAQEYFAEVYGCNKVSYFDEALSRMKQSCGYGAN